MCFIPVTLEVIGTTLASYYLLDLSLFEGILLGCALGAVSPAVVSPRMIKLIDKGYGYNSNVPKLVLAGSSVDDIYVIVVFYAFLGLAKNNTFDVLSIALIPITIIGGILVGVLSGFVLCYIFNKILFKYYFNVNSFFFIDYWRRSVETIFRYFSIISNNGHGYDSAFQISYQG